MAVLLADVRRNPLLWRLVFLPVVSGAEKAAPESHTFVTNGGRSAWFVVLPPRVP